MGSYPEEGYVEYCAKCEQEMDAKARMVWAAKPALPKDASKINIKAQLFDVILNARPNILKEIFDEVSNKA